MITTSLGQPFLEECPSDPPTSYPKRCHLCSDRTSRTRERARGGNVHKAAAARLSAQLHRVLILGYWSRYDLRFVSPATQAYDSLHISLLQVARRPALRSFLQDGYSLGLLFESSRLPVGSRERSVVCLEQAVPDNGGLTVAVLGPGQFRACPALETMLSSIGYRVIVASWQPGPELAGAELRVAPAVERQPSAASAACRSLAPPNDP